MSDNVLFTLLIVFPCIIMTGIEIGAIISQALYLERIKKNFEELRNKKYKTE